MKLSDLRWITEKDKSQTSYMNVMLNGERAVIINWVDYNGNNTLKQKWQPYCIWKGDVSDPDEPLEEWLIARNLTRLELACWLEHCEPII